MKIEIIGDNFPKSGHGTKVYTESGEEIRGVTDARLNFEVDGLVTATITVIVTDISVIKDAGGK